MPSYAELTFTFAGRDLVVMPIMTVTHSSPNGHTDADRRFIDETLAQKYPGIAYRVRHTSLDQLLNPVPSTRDFYRIALSFTLSFRSPERSASRTTGYSEFEIKIETGSGEFSDLYAAIADYRGHAHLGAIPQLAGLLVALGGDQEEQNTVTHYFRTYALGTGI